MSPAEDGIDGDDTSTMVLLYGDQMKGLPPTIPPSCTGSYVQHFVAGRAASANADRMRHAFKARRSSADGDLRPIPSRLASSSRQLRWLRRRHTEAQGMADTQPWLQQQLAILG